MLKPRNRHVLIGALLFALIVRAMIPAGFMPAASFSFQICPDGYPAHLLQPFSSAPANAAADSHAGHHPGGHAHGLPAADALPGAGHAHAGLADNAPLGASHSHEAFADDARLAPGAGHASHEDGTHRHASAGTEHCVFAAVASAGPLGWSATFSAPAAVAQAPEFIYRSPAIRPLRFRVPQPRGPPALS